MPTAGAKLPYLLAYGAIFFGTGAAWSLGLFGRKAPFWRGAAWWALLFGAYAFVVTTQVQPPLQEALVRWGQVNQVSVYIYGFGSTLISGIVQELLKLLAMVAPVGLWMLLGKAKPGWAMRARPSWLALGVAAGTGFGVWEAWSIAAIPLSTSGVISGVSILERVFAIAYHIATPVIMAYGLHKRRLWPYLGLAILSHGVANYAAVLYYQWVISLAVTEGLLIVFDLMMVAYARSLGRRVLREEL